MRKLMCAIAAAGFLAGLANADVKVAGQQPVKSARKLAGHAGHYSYDFKTGRMVKGQAGVTDATLVYDNTINSSGFAFSGAIGSEMGDDCQMIAGGKLTDLGISIYNSDLSAGPLNTCDMEVKFYDSSLVLIDSVVIPVDLSADPLQPGFALTATIENLAAENITLPRAIFITQTYSNVTGGATDLGLAINNPTEVGWSQDGFYQDGTSNFWFRSDCTLDEPVANMAYAVSVEAPTGLSLVHTTGAPLAVCFNGAPSLLGFISGTLATSTERWSAIPFKVAAATTLKEVDVFWFGQAGSEADTVNYIIWKRTGLNKPTSNADKFSEGVLGPFDMFAGKGTGVEALSGSLFTYPMNVPIPAGDYYLTVYGAGGPPDNWIAWFTGGDKQDEALELTPSSMWRSANFPTPGFVQYTTPALSPILSQPDFDDSYNPCFALWAAGGCKGDITGNGKTCQEDLGALLASYGLCEGQPGYNPLANLAPNSPGPQCIDQADLGALLADFGCGGCP